MQMQHFQTVLKTKETRRFVEPFLGERTLIKFQYLRSELLIKIMDAYLSLRALADLNDVISH